MIPRDWPSSLWVEQRVAFDLPEIELTSRFDVAIVGAGYTGLWSAIHLKELLPDVRVAVFDAVEPGFGASGRNGGWCSGLFPIEIDALSARHGRDAALRMQRAAIRAVDDVGNYVSSHGLDCDWAKSGTLTVATNTVQQARLAESIALQHAHGLGGDDVRWIARDELDRRVVVESAHGAMYSPHCAALHPMKLVNGLVNRALALGVGFVTGFVVERIDTHGIVGAHHGRRRRIVADWVIRATEGYTPHLKRERRSFIPLYSYMVATEPLDAATRRAIRWDARETLAEGRLMVTYAQLTADGRIAFGGRGAGYRYASRISPRFDRDESVRRRIVETLHALFPAAREAKITHHWGGPLAVPRDWHPAVTIDRAERRIAAGGYVGDGVALSHLAGRTVAAAVAGIDSDDLTLPLAHHVNRRWEPEPLRWLGVNAGLHLPNLADAIESRTGRPARRTTALIDRLLG